MRREGKILKDQLDDRLKTTKTHLSPGTPDSGDSASGIQHRLSRRRVLHTRIGIRVCEY